MDKNAPLFPISIVEQLTKLTPRQIRYYEKHGVVQPMRTSGRQRLFSMNDIDHLLDVKNLIEKGINVAGVKEMLLEKRGESKKNPEISESALRDWRKRELLCPGKSGLSHLTQGELSRFFKEKQT